VKQSLQKKTALRNVVRTVNYESLIGN